MTTTDSELTALFLDSSRKLLFGQHWPRMKTCVESLTTEQIWWRPNEASNSIGNLLLHLNGNVRQWLVISFNRGEDKRNRPAEFAAKEGGTAKELAGSAGRHARRSRPGARPPDARRAAGELRSAGLSHERASTWSTTWSSTSACTTDRLSYITKLLSGKDLGFYKELNKTGRA